MITPGNPNPPVPAPGNQVCIPVTLSGSGTPTVTVTHQNGTSQTLTPVLQNHPANTWAACFAWPGGNTISDVTVSVGRDTITFSVVGSGGP